MIGEYLTGRRNEVGISVEELSKRTRIRRYYLMALEKEEFHKIPGETYIKGHIQTYLKALGLDPSEGLKIYNDECSHGQKHTPAVTKNTDFNPVKTNPAKSVKSYKYVLAAIILIVCPVIYFLYSHKVEKLQLKTDVISKAHTNIKGFIDKVNSVNQDNTSKEAQPTVPQAAKETSTLSNEEPPAAVVVTPAPAITNIKRHTLLLKASDLTWLSVKIDGEETKQMFLKPMETVEWVSDNNFILKLGNAGGVKIVFDGKELDGSWQKGSVVTLELPQKPSPTETPTPE